jgi:cyanophycin synthetase
MQKCMMSKASIKKLKHGGFRSFIKKAAELGVKMETFPQEPSLLKLEYGGKVVFVSKSHIPVPKKMGNFTRNKELTKILFKSVGICVPRGIVAKTYKDTSRLIKKEHLAYPLIVKPLDGSLARGVTWNIRSIDELKRAVSFFDKSKKSNKSRFLVEEMFIGDEFRVLVFNGEIVSCVKKVPATIIGDGKSDIRKLIKTFDKTRAKGFEIKLDKIAKKTLWDNKLKLTSILPADHVLKLRNNLNMSDGGRCIECTEKMSKHLKDICLLATSAAGLSYGGIDLLTKNIATSKNDYVILEINPNPFYNMHEKPLVEGKGVDVSKKILQHLFPKLK